MEVVLSDEERGFHEAHVRKTKVPRSLSDRCMIILLCAEGLQRREIAARIGVHENTGGKWRRRFADDCIEGLSDENRSGRPGTVTDDKVAEVVERTVNTMPKDAVLQIGQAVVC
ncbi:MAG: helix-turn-helix domain-containing protein [Paracoccaceae bacterium]|nr:helix-turn-helix domain-containing protein [Paracoccaceae bacterium]